MQERFGLAAIFLEIFWRFPKNGVLAMKKWQQVGHQAGEAAKLQIQLKDGADPLSFLFHHDDLAIHRPARALGGLHHHYCRI